MNEGDAHIYSLGRPVERLQEPYRREDTTFASTRLDDTTVKDAELRHCSLVNLSFLRTRIQNGRFQNCTFIGCYFRRAEFASTTFIGCRFVDCHFGSVQIRSSEFQYSTFRGCQIAFSELQHNLPSEPNLREELARNLSLESRRLGMAAEARRYRLAEIAAREENLYAAMAGNSDWYKKHFDTFSRLAAAVQWSLSRLNGFLWGYGERSRILVRNVVVLTAVVFPLLFCLLRDGLRRTTGGDVRALDPLFFSIDNMLPVDFGSGVEAVSLAARFLASTESVFGLLAVALLASHIIRWSLYR